MIISIVKKILMCGTVAVLASCDSGDIYDTSKVDTDTGGAVAVRGKLTGLNNWPEGYSLAIAEFKEGDNNVVSQKIISDIGADGEIDVKLTNLNTSSTNVELCVTSTIRKRVLTLKDLGDVSKLVKGDTLKIDLGEVDLSPFSAIQIGVFDQKCTACHGNTGSAAAEMFLTHDKSYSNIVGQPSSTKDGEMRVIAGNAQGSLLHKVLATDGIGILSLNHTGFLASIGDADKILSFIDTWIDTGAKK